MTVVVSSRYPEGLTTAVKFRSIQAVGSYLLTNLICPFTALVLAASWSSTSVTVTPRLSTRSA